MRKVLRLADYSKMNEAERAEAVRELASAALGPPNGGLKQLDDEIRAFERRYELRSDRLTVELEAGRMRETADIARWLMAIDLKRRIVARQARP